MSVHRFPFRAMACGCEVMLAAVDQAAAATLAQVAVDEVQRIENKYSRYRADSLLSQINAAAGGEPVACDDETWALLNYAQTLFVASGGLFDITSGVLRRGWDFKQARVPSAAQLQPLLALIGWPRVQREAQQVRLPTAGMELDFGGFGKEYAADCAAAALSRQGVQHGYVNLGGDIRVLGPQADASPWLMGIQHPRRPGRLLATVPLSSGGLATSGDYERYFELDGHRYCHVLDPRSAQPVTQWRSVSVLAPLAVVAGTCSTITMLKQAQGLDFLRSTGMAYLAVDHEGQVHQRHMGAAPGTAPGIDEL